MLILSLDTTTRYGSVGLVSERQLLAEINYLSPSTHSRQVFRALSTLLKIAGKQFDDIDGLAVAVGPGSFTGIRIGLSLAKALSLASGWPVASVCSLQALASKLLLPGIKMISPIIDARKGEVFACLYQIENSRLQEVVPAGAYEPEKFLAMIPGSEPVYFIGTGVDLYLPFIKERLGPRAMITDRSYYLASEIGQLGQALLSQGKGLKPGEIEPIYYRPSQAEEKRTAKAKK
ncbi:MAG TPA: tRNA (adenosine(37)-N6)-threonylcarbamoyltransferase complex dimerization subunit type 1 TsaB [Candidatus Saccharicenans sp.]|jgi:tRNA threonylcarbamoyladenosine biosynthesis protein TsaB|nr:tRNA (adenosine(37)-N6)-threonylcarbamoyltransferase complex dimerization subunit type 1 TsaB [Candidatus Saccharicenans sp.]HRD01659.1 tRNA (adenosine(37)-N6)-threonylcarbamoyltransferase complex dimerization subunit type 1 TsaB [Candidatus Saccharicenans sp.]